jgi:hypothetical protein
MLGHELPDLSYFDKDQTATLIVVDLFFPKCSTALPTTADDRNGIRFRE